MRSKSLSTIIEPVKSVAPKPITPTEQSLLDKIAAGHRVIICELDPPKTLALEKYFAGAQALVGAGCDAITLADNSLAILRVSNLAANCPATVPGTPAPAACSAWRTGTMSEIPSPSEMAWLTRREGVIGTWRSEGMAALGMRHVLPLTGDPARIGDHPGAASVYDVNSVQLIGIVRRMNEGFNHAGKSIRAATQFVIGCTLNPNSKNLETQISRLQRKVAAGAQFVMTQPIFDLRILDEMEARTRDLDVPIFTGVWPLLSARQAEFLHNEVPGIIVPDAVRRKMAGSDGPEAAARGLEIARQISQAALERFRGVYLITPFLKYAVTVELATFARNL